MDEFSFVDLQVPPFPTDEKRDVCANHTYVREEMVHTSALTSGYFWIGECID